MADISKLQTPDGKTYSLKDEAARAGKQNIRNGIINGAVNWDTLTTAGTYKIQKAIMTADYNAPVDEYPHGILIVFDSESGGENRIMQIYFPHSYRHNYMYTRMRNGGTWNNWKSLSKDADTVDGKHASDFAAADHTHDYAGESSKGGFMSADDKTKLDGLSKITVERFDATTDAWSHVKLFATGSKVPIAAVFVYNAAMYSIFAFNTDYYIELHDTSMNAIPNTAVSFDLICKEG